MFQNLVRHVNDGALQGEGFQSPFDLPIVLLQNPELRLVFFIFPKLAFMTWTSYSTEPPGVAILTFRVSGVEARRRRNSTAEWGIVTVRRLPLSSPRSRAIWVSYSKNLTSMLLSAALWHSRWYVFAAAPWTLKQVSVMCMFHRHLFSYIIFYHIL